MPEELRVTLHGNFVEQLNQMGLFDHAYSVSIRRMLADGLGVKMEGREYPVMDEDEMTDRMVDHIRTIESRFWPMFDAEPQPVSLTRVRELLLQSIDSLLVEA